MKKLSTFFGVISSFAMLIGGIATITKHSNNQFVEVNAANAQSDIDEFTNDGQFTYTAGTGTTLSVLSFSEAAAVAAGNDGAVLRVNGQNTSVTIDFSGSEIKAKRIISIDFRVYVADSSSSLTQADFRIRKNASSVVVNEGDAGHSFLSVRNQWEAYSRSSQTFRSGYSFDQFADANGYLASFELFFRTSAWINVYIDYINVTLCEDPSGDYGIATLSDVDSNFVSPKEINAATSTIVLNKMSPFGAHSIALKFYINIPASTGVQLNFTACSDFGKAHYTIRFGVHTGSDNAYVSLLYNNAAVTTTANFAFARGTTQLIEFYSVVMNSTTLHHELFLDDAQRFSYDTNYIESDIGRVVVLESYQNTTSTTVLSDVDVVDSALKRFGARKLDSETIPFDDNRDTGACLTKYAQAKAFFNTYLTQGQKMTFATNATYANLKARMAAWASANGEIIQFDANGNMSVSSLHSPFIAMQSSQSVVILVLIISSLIVVSIIALKISKNKKRE